MKKRKIIMYLHSIQTKIQLKLLLLFIFVALIPIVLLGLISYDQSSKLVNTQFGDYGEFAVSQLQHEVETTIDHMHLIASNIQNYLSDPTLIVLKKEQPTSYSDFIAQKNFERFLEAHKTTQTKGIFLITKNRYYYGNTFLNSQQLNREWFWKEHTEKMDKESWTGIYIPNHYYRDDESKVIGLLMPSNISYGVLDESWILVETDATELFQFIHQLETDLHSHITIMDKQKNVLYSSNPNDQSKSNDIIWKRSIESNGWNVEVRIPEKEFYKSSEVILFITLIGIVVSFGLALLLAFLLSRKFTSNILQLDKAIKKVSAGDFNTQIAVTSHDEVGSLASNFNKMVIKIRQLIQEIYKKEQMKKDAELKAIHYQINPHLLLNTLNSVQWKAKLQGAGEVAEMIYHLVQVLEDNLNFSNELVPLKDELTVIDHYLYVQRIRFGNHFTYEKEIEAGIEEYLMPRMSLQPLFENVFFHAFEDGIGDIKLKVFEHGKHVCLQLVDNGRGIPLEKLRTLCQAPPSSNKKGGIGLYNIDQKFKLHFGQEYGLSFKSVVSKGTEIHIRWPKKGVSDETN
ncbi:sensor histidine kinase [Pseudalkalibacillus sp. A8]|uniref:sensor histidine kinase n=1 Tax=Pseudalkalibacillus sp. A8 TaxID=3382641 RepID=UPI0038B66BE6